MQTHDVREAAQSAVDQSKSFLSKQVDERSTKIGQQIESVARDLRNVGDQLRQSGAAGPVATYVDQGVELIERVAGYLQEADGEQLVGDLENYARRRPWAVAAGALALGFAASRFLKTSSVRRYQTYGTAGTYGNATTYGNTATYGATARYGDTETDSTGAYDPRTSGGGRYAT